MPRPKFSRLRPAPIQKDPLEAAGLPSKGDKTLLNLAAQESYYAVLLGRYMDWCAATGTQGVGGLRSQSRTASGTSAMELDLSRSFDGMSLDGTASFCEQPQQKKPAPTAAAAVKNSKQAATTATTAATIPSPSPSPAAAATAVNTKNELATLHMSMRKLREAILSTSRTDAFAQHVYIFITRAGVLSQTYESYHPALLHLLYGIHAATPLSSSTLHEIISYQILDTACRLGNYSEALALRCKWGFRDHLVDAVLTALVRDDWVSFWRVREDVDGYRRALMGWAEDRVRKHALKCLGKAYLSVARGFVERTAGGRVWRELVASDGVGWEEDGDLVVIRRVKSGVKTAAKTTTKNV